MPEQSSHTYRYWAFISYSNKDVKWSRWLHRAIERYDIPARLVSDPTPTGEPAPRRLDPLFRDRDELPASADLGAQIEESLRASRFLIVVCSPHAAKSRWVNKEIETFRSLGREDRLLAVVVDGEPHGGGDSECFPPSLRGREPVAADARPVGDGKTGAKLKLIAGMLGVGFDVLRQRDSQRRVHRLQLTVILALALAAGLAGLASYANWQREKAIRARNQAEYVLEFLVYEMREELMRVGRLELSEQIRRRVQEYYQHLGVQPESPRTLRNRATEFNNRGDLLSAQGNLGEALTSYRQSLTVRERLATNDPTNAEWQRDLSVSYNKVGDVLLTQGNPEEALTSYRQSLAVRERLAASDQSNAGWQRDLSVSQDRIGDVLVAQGNLGEALTSYRQSLTVRERLAASDPTSARWERDLSLSHNKIGDVLLDQGNLGEALTAYRESLALAGRLAASDPSNAELHRDLSVSQDRIGDVLVAQGNLGEAPTSYRQSLTVRERLATNDPTNAEWQRDLSVSYNKVGDVLLTQGNPEEALTSYRQSLAVRERLAASDQSNAGWQRDLFVSYVKLAQVAEQTAQGDACSWWRKAYEQLAGMKRRGIMLPTDEQHLGTLRQKAGL